MAQWYNFVQSDGFEPEIRVGLYDMWLCQVEFGPTQADRMLVHTPMLDLAHERRVAVCEARMDITSFETQHRKRMRFAIDRLEDHFSSNQSEFEDNPFCHEDSSLSGPTPMLTKFDVIEAGSLLTDGQIQDAEHLDSALRAIWQQSSRSDQGHKPNLLRSAGDIIVDDSMSLSGIWDEEWLGGARPFSQRIGPPPTEHPRQPRNIRMRKAIAECYTSSDDQSGFGTRKKRKRSLTS